MSFSASRTLFERIDVDYGGGEGGGQRPERREANINILQLHSFT